MTDGSAGSAFGNAARIAEYSRCGVRTGPLITPTDAASPVQFRRVASARQRMAISILATANLALGLAFIGWLLVPKMDGLVGWRGLLFLGVHLTAALVVVAAQIPALAVWVFAFIARDPVPWTPQPGLRIALLTTIVPAKEPLEMVEKTLTAMTGVGYAGQVDIWILDEGDDARVKEVAAELGVRHFTRWGRPEYNRDDGPFRRKCKAGNHNAWLAEHGDLYDIVVQMDPDHVPFPWLLDRCLGYFRDPDVAFVAMPHVYGNRHDNWVTYGASGLMFPWNSITLRGGNGLGAPVLEGANHAYRPSAWQAIGGYQDALSEDRLTGMRILGTLNPRTGNRFKGVYTPDVLTVGEAPSTWTDWFNQQKRWTYGIWQIYLTPRMRAAVRPNFRRPATSLAFVLHDIAKPVELLSVVMLGVLTATHLLLNDATLDKWSAAIVLWGFTQLGFGPFYLWLRRYYATPHERDRIGLRANALRQVTGPIYTAAGLAALLGRPLTYVVTAKSRLKSPDLLSTFRLHLWWAAIAITILGCTLSIDRGPLTIPIAFTVLLMMVMAPPIAAWVTHRRKPGATARRPAQRRPIRDPLPQDR